MGNTWEADRPYTPGGWGYYGGGSTRDRGTGREIAGTEDDRIYQTLRFNFDGYRFDLDNGTYHVTFHFAETYFTATGKRVFDVSIEGLLVIDDLDIVAHVGYGTALVIEVPGVVVADGQLDISFSASVDYPMINGIEIVATAP